MDLLFKFLLKNSTIDVTKEQEVERNRYYKHLFNWCYSISLIDFCCLFDWLNCLNLFYGINDEKYPSN